MVDINFELLFDTYLLVPRQGSSPAVFSSGAPLLPSSECFSASSFLNLKTETGMNESHQNTVVKLG